MIEQTQKYTTLPCESSGRREMFHAAVLINEAAQLLKNKASRLPDCAQSVRLQRIATRFGEFSNCIKRVSMAIERGHPRKSPRAAATGEVKRPSDGAMNLSQLEAELTLKLQRLPIGSGEARRLFGVRERVRQELATSPESLDPSYFEGATMAVEHSLRGAA